MHKFGCQSEYRKQCSCLTNATWCNKYYRWVHVSLWINLLTGILVINIESSVHVLQYILYTFYISFWITNTKNCTKEGQWRPEGSLGHNPMQDYLSWFYLPFADTRNVLSVLTDACPLFTIWTSMLASLQLDYESGMVGLLVIRGVG